MKQGTNVLTLTIPAGSVNNGVVYDYLRLELDETAQAPITQ
jgi:rhamnogalacturonan endolyase